MLMTSLLTFAVSTSLLAGTPFDDDRDVKLGPGTKAPAMVTLSGKVTEWVGGSPGTSATEKPNVGVSVLVGKDLDLSTGSTGTDGVSGKVAARVTTDEKGAWTAKVPAGTYVVVYWKAGYTPQTDSNKAAPGTLDASISADKAGRGLHQSLSVK